MLQNAYFLAKIGADTAENEQHFADFFCQKLATTRQVHLQLANWQLAPAAGVEQAAMATPRQCNSRHTPAAQEALL